MLSTRYVGRAQSVVYDRQLIERIKLAIEKKTNSKNLLFLTYFLIYFYKKDFFSDALLSFLPSLLEHTGNRRQLEEQVGK